MIDKLHKTKRLATIRLLLDIIVGGSPKDSIFATGCVVALEKSPETAAFFAYYPLEYLDTQIQGSNESHRDEYIKLVRELLAAAEKK